MPHAFLCSAAMHTNISPVIVIHGTLFRRVKNVARASNQQYRCSRSCTPLLRPWLLSSSRRTPRCVILRLGRRSRPPLALTSLAISLAAGGATATWLALRNRLNVTLRLVKRSAMARSSGSGAIATPTSASTSSTRRLLASLSPGKALTRPA